MNDKLTIVDAFEQRYGHKSAMDRTSDFLIKYMSLNFAGISEIARAALEIAARYRQGRANLGDLKAGRIKLENFLRVQSAWTEYSDPEYGPAHSVYAILWNLEEPMHGGGASELISNVFEATKILRPEDEIVNSLLIECFQPVGRVEPKA